MERTTLPQLVRVLAVAWLYLLISVSVSFAQEVLPMIVKRIQPSIVVIVTYDSAKKPLTQGSGFFISQTGDVITNCHVLHGAKTAEIKVLNGQTYSVSQVVADDPDADLVRIKTTVPENLLRHLTISSALPEVGQRIFVIGSPLGLEQTVTDGIVSAVRQVPSLGNIIQISAPISPGSSGSPVVNLQGEVVGVATLQMVEGQNLNFAIPGQKVLGLTPKRGDSIALWNTETAKTYLKRGLKLGGSQRLCVPSDHHWMNAGLAKVKEALPNFFRAIAADPLLIDAYVAAGRCYSHLNEHTAAIDVFKQAINIEPGNAELLIDLAEQYIDLSMSFDPWHFRDDEEASKKYWEKCCEQHEEAIKIMEQAVRLDPQNAFACYKLGKWYSESLARVSSSTINDITMKKAVNLLWQAIRSKPDYVDAYMALGLDYERLGEYQFAIEAYRFAAKYDPDDYLPHYLMGEIFVQLGDLESAENEYNILLIYKKKEEQGKTIFDRMSLLGDDLDGLSKDISKIKKSGHPLSD